VELLVKKGAKVDATDKNGCTPLLYAVTLNHMTCSKHLLNKKANPSYQDKRLRSPAHCAAAKGSVEALKLLREKGGDHWLRNGRGEYPIHEAALAKQNETVQYLMRSSKDPEGKNLTNYDGRSAMHIAAAGLATTGLVLTVLCGYSSGHGLGYSPFRGYTRYGAGAYRRYNSRGQSQYSSFTPVTRSLVGPAAEIWTQTDTVPEKLERVPDQLLQIQFGALNVAPNQTVLMSQLQRRPQLFWEADPNSLYLVMIEDVDVLEVVSAGAPNTGKHWMVVNIPGNDVASGEEIADYLQSFFFANAEGGLDYQGTRDQRHIVMVYRQTRRITDGELGKMRGCGEPRVGDGARLGPNHQALFPRLDLEGPVAANFYRIGYQQGWSEFFVCYVKGCNGFSLIPASKIPDVSPQRELLQCLNE